MAKCEWCNESGKQGKADCGMCHGTGQIETAIEERNRLKAELATAQQGAAAQGDIAERLRRELAEAKAEIERMRPVVDAAVDWYDSAESAASAARLSVIMREYQKGGANENRLLGGSRAPHRLLAKGSL